MQKSKLNLRQYENRYWMLKDLILEQHKKYYQESLIAYFQQTINSIQEYKTEVNKQVAGSDAKLLSPVINEVDQLSFKVQELINGLEDKFLLFVVGMGKLGKSTVINALLEEDEAAEMDYLPKTWKIDIFESKNDSQCEIKYKDGSSKSLKVEDTKKEIIREEKRVEASRKDIKQKLKQAALTLKTIEEKRELQQALEDQLLYKSDIIEVRWPVKENILTKKYKLVDTPGLVQENLSGETKLSLQEYYHKADGVIWLLDANRLSQGKNKEMLDELKSAVEQVGGKTNNIIAVINRIDSIRNRDGEEAVKKMLEQAPKLFGEFFTTFIPLSAKEAHEGYKNEDLELREKSGIFNLYEEIERCFFKKAQDLRLETKRTSFLQLLKPLDQPSHIVNTYLKRLDKDQMRFISNKEDMEKRFLAIVQNFDKEMGNLKDSMIKAVNERINYHTEKLYDKNSVYEKERYMKDIIYRVDENENKLQTLLSFWMNEVEDATKELKVENEFHEYEHITEQFVQSFLGNPGELSISSSTPAITQKFAAHSQVPSGTNMSGMKDFFLGIFGKSLGGVLSDMGKGLAKIFGMKGVQRRLEQNFKTYIDKYCDEVEKHFKKQNDVTQVFLVNDMDLSFSRLHSFHDTSLIIKKLTEDLKMKLDEQHEPPSLLTILEKEKLKIR